MKLYKLTDEKDQTRNQTQWGPNVTHTTNGEGDLCGPGWLHAYTSPYLAVLLNPIHADFASPHLWAAEGDLEKDDKGLKCGTRKLTTLKRLKLPKATLIIQCRFAILCAKAVYTDKQFRKWADEWLSGRDRTANAANAAYAAANAANAVYAAAYAAANAVYAAANAAYAAAYAAYVDNAAANAANAVYAAAYAANAVYAAANAANAAKCRKHLNLNAIAKKAFGD